MRSRNRIYPRNRIVRALFLLIVSILLIYFLLGAPSLTVKMAYKKTLASYGMKEVRVVGTANIEAAAGRYDEILVAETMDKIHLFCHQKNWNGWQEENLLVWRERTNPIMILTPPGWTTIDWESERKDAKVPLVLLGAPKEAVCAELEVEITKVVPVPYTVWTEEVTGILRGEAKRKEDLFLFWFQQGEENEDEYDFIVDLADVSTGNYMASYQVKVRFYDENENLIQEEEVELKTPALEAHEEAERRRAF